MSEPSINELKDQIRKYEQQLEQEKLKNARQRDKITKMSAEVVDSNPYRLLLNRCLNFKPKSVFYVFSTFKSFDGLKTNGNC